MESEHETSEAEASDRLQRFALVTAAQLLIAWILEKENEQPVVNPDLPDRLASKKEQDKQH
jgi:hypothetical protein